MRMPWAGLKCLLEAAGHVGLHTCIHQTGVGLHCGPDARGAHHLQHVVRAPVVACLRAAVQQGAIRAVVGRQPHFLHLPEPREGCICIAHLHTPSGP